MRLYYYILNICILTPSVSVNNSTYTIGKIIIPKIYKSHVKHYNFLSFKQMALPFGHDLHLAQASCKPVPMLLTACPGFLTLGQTIALHKGWHSSTRNQFAAWSSQEQITTRRTCKNYNYMYYAYCTWSVTWQCYFQCYMLSAESRWCLAEANFVSPTNPSKLKFPIFCENCDPYVYIYIILFRHVCIIQSLKHFIQQGKHSTNNTTRPQYKKKVYWHNQLK